MTGGTLRKGKTHAKEGDEHPANYISWEDCEKFVGQLNEMEGIDGYGIPTATEWEHARRAGSQGDYCFGDDESMLEQYAWCENAGNERYGDNPKEAGGKRPNRWGLYDMHGNVDEWCGNDRGRSSSTRVLRGGSWRDYAEYCRSGDRGSYGPDYWYDYSGHRLIRLEDRS